MSVNALQKSREFLEAELSAEESETQSGAEEANGPDAETEPKGDAHPFASIPYEDEEDNESSDEEAEPESGPAAPDAPAPAPGGEVLFDSIDGKKFTSTDELRAYVRDLEKKQLATEVSGKKAESKTESAPANPLGVDINELFVNPEKVLAEFAKRVREDVVKEVEAKADTKDYWTGFYSRNSEFKGLEDMIDLAYSKLVSTHGSEVLASMKRDEAEKLLVKQAKEIVGRVRGKDGTVLPKGKPVTVPSGKGSGSKAPVKKTEAEGPKNFVEQMQAHRETRMKSARK